MCVILVCCVLYLCVVAGISKTKEEGRNSRDIGAAGKGEEEGEEEGKRGGRKRERGGGRGGERGEEEERGDRRGGGGRREKGKYLIISIHSKQTLNHMMSLLHKVS